MSLWNPWCVVGITCIYIELPKVRVNQNIRATILLFIHSLKPKNIAAEVHADHSKLETKYACFGTCRYAGTCL
jgi:hypothetical protein